MKPLILQSDFGTADGAVSAMYGVAYGVCQDLSISDLTHEIPQYDIWEASYRLIQTVSYWPEGAVICKRCRSGSRIYKTEYRCKNKNRTVYRNAGQWNPYTCKKDHRDRESKSDR